MAKKFTPPNLPEVDEDCIHMGQIKSNFNTSAERRKGLADRFVGGENCPLSRRFPSVKKFFLSSFPKVNIFRGIYFSRCFN
jgi:hypothetical protein